MRDLRPSSWRIAASMVTAIFASTSAGCGSGGADSTSPVQTGGAGGGSAGGGQSGMSQVAGTGGTGVAGATSTGGNGGAGGKANGGQGGSGKASGGSGGGSGAAGAVGTGGGGGASGAPSDPCAGRIVCETFESTAPGKAPGAPWEVHTAKGTVAVDEARAYGGKRSLKVSTTATSTGDTYRQAMLAITGAPLLPLANDTVYGRFMIFTDRIPDKTVHWTFAHGDGPVDKLSATYNYGGMGGLMANYYKTSAPDPTDCWQTKDAPFPTKAWSCVAFLFDGKNDEMRFWLNGTEVPELHVVGLSKTDQTCTVKGVDGRWLAPQFKNVSVGWESYQHDVAGAHDAWIDDVIFDDKPIACP